MEGIRRTLLPSGLRVVSESLPELRSVAVGAWVGSGARDEHDPESGASHFLEHLLFKGTEDRTALEIAEAVESVGGEMNAFTTHEQTVFYVRLPASEAELAFDILGDVVWRPAFRPDDVESERQVILEEIGMRDDTPDDLVHDVFASALFPAHPLGREVLGSEQSICEMERDAIAQYHRAHYRPSNTVLAVAGCLTHDEVLEQVDRHFTSDEGVRPARANGALPSPHSRLVVERPTEQAHVVMGVRALPALDPDRYALTVLNQALGGGMSSRLFQEVREQRGLAYSVYSYRVGFDDTGILAVYAGTSPERLAETVAVVREQLQRVVDDGGLPGPELAAAKGHIKGSLAMSLETSSSRMRRLGRGELVEGEIPSIDELIARVDAVDADDVARVVERVLVGVEPTIALVGPLDEDAVDALG